MLPNGLKPYIHGSHHLDTKQTEANEERPMVIEVLNVLTAKCEQLNKICESL